MNLIFAAGGGSVILIVIIIAMAFGFYTYKGSAINAHPSDGLDGAPGERHPATRRARARFQTTLTSPATTARSPRTAPAELRYGRSWTVRRKTGHPK